MILFTLSAMQFISIVDFMIVMPLGPLLMDTLGIDTLQFSWVVSGYTLAAGFAGIAAATVLDRVGRRSAYIALSVGLLVGTLALVALPASWDYVRFMAREGTPVLGIPLFWVYVPFVLMLLAMVLRCAFAVRQALRGQGLDAELRL
ncbi:MAG: MFS transporter [Planctomycetia bacterium]|nr:MFS transporter [Planctomycetia bacterium]